MAQIFRPLTVAGRSEILPGIPIEPESIMTTLSVKQILGAQAPADVPVTVKGWVRTRRDSKAVLSFVNISN